MIFSRKGMEFSLDATLKEHDAVVTGLDWAPKTNRIVSCSHDRNAYVWTQVGNDWRPMLVILRLDRGATCVSWSPKEDKFAVGSGAKAIAVCYFESENNWWVSKHIKENINSTITCLDWHPNNVLLAAGGTDNVTRVFSAFVRGLDKREDFVNGTAFGDKLPFATLLAEFPVASWVHTVRWSPSGNQLAWATHDSYLYFLECSNKNHSLQTLKYSLLPFRDIIFIDEGRMIGVGHDCAPLLFAGGAGSWAFDRNLDEQVSQAKGAGGVSAKAQWQDRTAKGTAEGELLSTDLGTKHQNQIVEIRRINATMFSTIGIDGNLGVWPFAAVRL
jgi:actin related protein 2/3 complex subunit 1A/1B